MLALLLLGCGVLAHLLHEDTDADVACVAMVIAGVLLGGAFTLAPWRRNPRTERLVQGNVITDGTKFTITVPNVGEDRATIEAWLGQDPARRTATSFARVAVDAGDGAPVRGDEPIRPPAGEGATRPAAPISARTISSRHLGRRHRGDASGHRVQADPIRRRSSSDSSRNVHVLFRTGL